jgi:hypothetical protein
MAWCVQGWTWWYFELSWVSTTYLGAVQLDEKKVLEWSGPIFEAYIAGAWILHWTEDVLYWVAKPIVRVEIIEGTRRLHCEDGPALESDCENIYFWHGVLVPAFVITCPEWITLEDIAAEKNVEVRRVMIERFGQSRYLLESGAKEISRDNLGALYRKDMDDDEPIVMVKVTNSTPEFDGSQKDYFIRVPPDIATAKAAVAWSFGMKPIEYKPMIET